MSSDKQATYQGGSSWSGTGFSGPSPPQRRPLTRPEVLDVAAEFPELLFVLVTNGWLIDAAVLDKLQRARNVMPVLSLEGFESHTDGRRGEGVYARALRAMENMKERGLFFGTSIMVTRANYALTTSRVFIRDLVARGSAEPKL